MYDSLGTLENRDRPLRTGVIGAGEFGRKTVASLWRAPGMEPAVVADTDVTNALEALRSGGMDAFIGTDTADVEDALEANRGVATTPGALLSHVDRLDVVVDATGDAGSGARHAYGAIDAGTHVVMATVEADAVVGPWLSGFAENRGVVYTTAYGDQPALIADLVDWARTAGLDVVAAGRGASACDTNAAIEACSAANVTSLRPDRPAAGMHAASVSLPEVPDRLRPREDGGLLESTGVIETVLTPDDANGAGASVASGVFVVVTHPDESVREFVTIKNRAGAYVSDDGEYLVFWRPHHVPGVETTISVARAAMGSTAGAPRGHVADVAAVADVALDAGETLSPTYPVSERMTGRLVRAEAATERNLVPLPLLAGATTTRPVPPGEPITEDAVKLEEDSVLRRLRGLHDVL